MKEVASSQEPGASSGELIWAFDKPQTVGSICRPSKWRWNEGELIDPAIPMYILREATRAEWIAGGGTRAGDGPMYFYAVSVD